LTTRAGKPTDKGYLYKLLNNEVYLGQAVHKGTSYPGEHQGMIEPDLWAKVHGILQVSRRQRAAKCLCCQIPVVANADGIGSLGSSRATRFEALNPDICDGIYTFWERYISYAIIHHYSELLLL
jgi:hypothetical protein